MNISFCTLGMTFDAEVSLSTSRAATYWEPAEPSELEIHELTCQGSDALFLLDSTMAEDIQDAACGAALEAQASEREDAACYRAESRREEELTL